MKRYRSACLVGLLLIATLTACGSSGSSAKSSTDKSPIVLGMVEDTSGPSAPYSTISAQGVKDAVKELNANGGILGRPVQLVSADDGSSPTQSPTVVRQLVQEGAKELLLTSGSGAVIADKTVVQQSQVVAIAPTSIATQVVAPPDNTYVYTLANPTSDLGLVYSAAFKHDGISKVAVFTDNSSTTAANAKVLEAAFTASNINVVDVERVASNANDVSAEVSRMKNSGAQAVMAIDEGGQLEILLWNAVSSVMPTTKKFSIPTIGDEPTVWSLASSGALNGLTYASSVTDTNPRTVALKALFKKDNGPSSQFSLYAAQAYGGVQLLAKAITQAKTTSPAAVNLAMEKITKYQPAFGQAKATLSFSPTKHAGADALCGLSLVEFQNNKPGPLWSTYQPVCH